MPINDERSADYIYFPEYWEYGAWKPMLLYKTVYGIDNLHGITCAEAPEHADGGFGRVYKRTRLQPFTGRLWAACVAYVERRTRLIDDINSEYNDLMEGKVRLL